MICEVTSLFWKFSKERINIKSWYLLQEYCSALHNTIHAFWVIIFIRGNVWWSVHSEGWLWIRSIFFFFFDPFLCNMVKSGSSTMLQWWLRQPCCGCCSVAHRLLLFSLFHPEPSGNRCLVQSAVSRGLQFIIHSFPTWAVPSFFSWGEKSCVFFAKKNQLNVSFALKV